MIDVNLKGVWNGRHAVLPLMNEQESGAIINNSSLAAWFPSGTPTYAASKAGVLQLSRAVATEFGRYGIRINAICPGSVETPMFD